MGNIKSPFPRQTELRKVLPTNCVFEDKYMYIIEIAQGFLPYT